MRILSGFSKYTPHVSDKGKDGPERQQETPTGRPSWDKRGTRGSMTKSRTETQGHVEGRVCNRLSINGSRYRRHRPL